MGDRALSDYVSSMLGRGYTKAQLREMLLGQGYPESLVDATLKHAKPADPLTSYLKHYIREGYDANQLKQFLVSQGHTEREVNQALANATSVRHEIHFPLATVLTLLFIGIAVSGAFFGFQLLEERISSPEGQPRLLDVEVDLSETEVEAGDSISARIKVINMGESAPYDVHLDVKMQDANGVTLTAFELTKAISTSFTEAKQFALDEELEPGQYYIRVEAKYGGEMPAIASEPFRIVDEEAVQGDYQWPPRAPAPPRQDYVPPEPEPSQDTKAITERAVQLVERGDSQAANKACRSIEAVDARDRCLNTIVVVDQEPRHCEAVTTESARESCYLQFVIAGDYSYCEQLQDPNNLRLCETLQMFSDIDVEQYAPKNESGHIVEEPSLADMASSS